MNTLTSGIQPGATLQSERTMTPEAKARRAQKDHERYMRQREERLLKQQARYRANPEYHKRKAREWEQRQRERI